MLTAIGGATPAAASIDPNGPDLSMSITETPSTLYAGGQISYTLTITNTWFYPGGCDIGPNGRPICTRDTTELGAISGVDVQDPLPAGTLLLSTSNDAGFTCFTDLYNTLNCNTGAIPNSGVAHIDLIVQTSSLPAGGHSTLNNCATVNPHRTITERDYGNNQACISATQNTATATPLPR